MLQSPSGKAVEMGRSSRVRSPEAAVIGSKRRQCHKQTRKLFIRIACAGLQVAAKDC
jgi:hypothetical protein